MPHRARVVEAVIRDGNPGECVVPDDTPIRTGDDGIAGPTLPERIAGDENRLAARRVVYVDDAGSALVNGGTLLKYEEFASTNALSLL